MLPMSLSWLLVSFNLGKLLIKYGGKAVTLTSTVFILISSLLLYTLGINTPILLVLLFIFVIGIGFGGVSTALTVSVQDSVEYNKRGSAMAANSLLRTLGQTIGISVFGNIFNVYIANYLTEHGVKGVDTANLQSSAAQSSLLAEQIKLSLNSSMHALFVSFIIISGLSLILAVTLPGRNSAALKARN